MATKNLKYFMREQKEEIITIPGPESFVDDNEKPLQFEIKKLTQEKISKIYDMYRTKKVATDKKGKPIVENGQVVFSIDKDNVKAWRHILCEALVYPNLKDEEVMKYYDCIDFTEMPLKVFFNPKEYRYVEENVMKILGIIEDEKEEDDIADAKN